MKKIFSSLLIVTMIILNLSTLSVLAKDNDNGSTIKLELKVDEANGISYTNYDGTEYGPSSFALSNNYIYLLDSNKKLIYQCKDNKILNKIDINFIEYPIDIRVIKNKIWVLDRENSIIYLLNIDGKLIKEKELKNTINSPALLLDYYGDEYLIKDINNNVYEIDDNLNIKLCSNINEKVKRVNNKKGVILFNNRKSDININFNELFGTIKVLHEDNNNTYINVEEVLDAPIITVEQTVRKYDQKGNLLGIARIPLELYYAYPERFVDVDNNGNIYALVETKDNIEVIKLDLDQNFQSKLPKLKEEINNQLINNTNKIAPSIEPGSSMTRDEAEQRALSIINYQWTCNVSNRKSISGVTIPDYLRNVTLPYSAVGIPYCWGGFDSLDSSSQPGSWNDFLSAIAYGANAGNVNCSGGYKSGTAGLDCSGFVSAVIALGSHWPTTTLASKYYIL